MGGGDKVGLGETSPGSPLYTIKVEYIIGIWKIHFLIPPMDAELMGRHRDTSEGHDSLLIRASPKDNLILTKYMLSAW